MLEKRVVTMTIKKIYFDQILEGKKTVEYRDFKDYYIRKFEGLGPTHIRLHYLGDKMLEAKVANIRVIKPPAFLRESGVDFGNRVFAIELKTPKLL
jgi:ASC-1-like (ASCH) protein